MKTNHLLIDWLKKNNFNVDTLLGDFKFTYKDEFETLKNTLKSEKRYIRLANVKGTNNLRDFYYRDIVLGEQNEVVYEPTNNYEIALAFREAGEM